MEFNSGFKGLTLTDEVENGQLNKRTILNPQRSCEPKLIFFTTTVFIIDAYVSKYFP